MERKGLAVIFAVIANPLLAEDLSLFVQNSARLDECTLKVFRTELGAILAASGRPAEFSAWRPGSVTITLRQQPPDEESLALGRTYRSRGRLAPEIELFVNPTAQLIGTRLSGVLGRALARVATHELGHWLSQESGHATRGVMMERLSAAHLMASGAAFLRLPASD